MAIEWCENDDPRIQTLRKGSNVRWPVVGQEASAIAICQEPDDVLTSLNETLNVRRVRPTIRSGGHCYEGFVSNNAGGVIIDVSQLNSVGHDPAAPELRYRIGAGVQNWDGYVSMYKRWNRTLPGGSCYSVGVGGHISGGGFGYMSRLHGLTVDWLSGVGIVHLSPGGETVANYSTATATAYPALFKALRGAGNGNFGIITDYYFDELPIPPREAAITVMYFNWSDFDEARFGRLLNTFADYWDGRGRDEETFGIFGVAKLSHAANGQFFIRIQCCSVEPNGGIGAAEIALIQEFIDLFAEFQPRGRQEASYFVDESSVPWGAHGRSSTHAGQALPPFTVLYDWLYAVQQLNGASPNQRGKYKSSYMKQRFTDYEISRLYYWLHYTPPSGINLAASLVQVDSYGGNINKPGTAAQTSVPQRSSIMKLQYQAYWTDPALDAEYEGWINPFYADVYSDPAIVPAQYAGTPYPSAHYEGCYIGYPDAVMAELRDAAGQPFWQDLYYPGIYTELQQVKQTYDPGNVFNYALSVRP